MKIIVGRRDGIEDEFEDSIALLLQSGALQVTPMERVHTRSARPVRTYGPAGYAYWEEIPAAKS